jgi:serine/threonine-protein kinase
VIERIGNYRITDEIGSGGMAVVYKGIQESLGRTVAIKALKTSVSTDENVVARFEREATSVASFQQENIITVYDYFRDQGALFIVMEYVEGIDLYDLLDRRKTLPNDVAAIVSLQTARALDYAHFRGVIHRDVKPANIIISKLGSVKLTDFGIARTEASELTQAGVGLGTPAYMSPEQIVGDKLDHRSDIFSLGIVMYQMVTGQKPFVEDEQRSAMQKIRHDAAPPPRSLNPLVDKDLERIIQHCMQKRPDDRYASTQELVITLEQYLAAHVTQNYRARLVMFLKEEKLLSADETTATLHPALIGDYQGQRPLLRIRRRARWPLAFFAVLITAVAALSIVLAEHLRARRGTQPRPTCVTAPVEPPAYLRVVAHPWARVEIDGRIETTTPFDRPLALETGPHKIRLTNPYFETVERSFVLRKGETLTLTETLQRASSTDGPTSTEVQKDASAGDRGDRGAAPASQSSGPEDDDTPPRKTAPEKPAPKKGP